MSEMLALQPAQVEAQPALSKAVVPREEKRAILAAWLATPAPLRGTRTVADLVRSLGLTPRESWYQVLAEPETLAMALHASGLAVVAEIPEVLDVLVKGAKAGNVRAADVLLRHVRELVALCPAGHGPSASLSAILADTAEAARDLATLARSLNAGQVQGPAGPGPGPEGPGPGPQIGPSQPGQILDRVEADLALDLGPGPGPGPGA